MANPTDGSYSTYAASTSTVESFSSINGPYNSKTSNKVVASTYSWSRYSQRTPGYGGIKRYGLPMNKYSFACTDIVNWNGMKQVVWPKQGHILRQTNVQSGVYANFNDYPSHVPSNIVSAMENEVIAKVLGRLKDQKANHLENAATYKQNVGMIVNAVTRIGQAANRLRHGDIAGAARRLGVQPRNFTGFNRQFARDQSKAVANGWLELQYGWLPLCSDIYETAELIHRRLQKKTPLQRVSAGSSKSFTTVSKSSATDGDTVMTNEAKAEVKVILYYSTPNENLKSLVQLGITNPLSLAWELVPWSFVVDWFLPIGSFVSNLDAGLGAKFRKGCKTTALVSKLTATKTAHGKQSGGFTYNTDLKAFAKRVAINRIDLAGFPLPTLPQFKDPLSAMHLANATALLVQQMKRPNRPNGNPNNMGASF